MEIVPERERGCENCKYRGMDETQEPCAHCTKNAVDNYEPMTNGDYIRSLSDTELAQIVMCPNEFGFCEVTCKVDEQHCVECTRRWLEAEREVDEVRNTSEQLKVGDSK
jgi:hypothetical protein